MLKWKTFFAGAAEACIHSAAVMLLVAVEDFFRVRIHDKKPFLPFAEHFDHKLIIALDHLGMVPDSERFLAQAFFAFP